MKRFFKYTVSFLLVFALVLGIQNFINPKPALATTVPPPDNYPEQPAFTGTGAVSSDYVRITLTAITCAEESSLPNWNFARGPKADGTHIAPWQKRNGPPNTLKPPVVIGPNTASDFIATHPNCWYQDNVSWGWGPALNPPDVPNVPEPFPYWSYVTPTSSAGISSAYVPWSKIGPKIVKLDGRDTYNPYFIDDNCKYSADCPEWDWTNPTERRIYVSVFTPGRFPFSTYTLPNWPFDDNPVSAELRCYDNSVAYDDYEFVGSPQQGASYYCIYFDYLRDNKATVKLVSPDLPTDIYPIYATAGTPCRIDGNCSNISGSITIPFQLTGPTSTLTLIPGSHPGYHITSTTFVNGITAKANNNQFANLFGLINYAKASDCNGTDTCTLGPGDQATYTVRYAPDTPPPPSDTCTLQLRGYLDGVNQATNASFTLTGPETQGGSDDAPLKTYTVKSGSYTLTHSNTTDANGKTYSYDTGSGDPTTLTCAAGETRQFYLRYVSVPLGNCRVDSFKANPASVVAGDYSTLSWSVSNVTSMTVDGVDSNSVGSLQRGPFQNTKTFQLLGNGPDGGTCTASVTVTVVSGSDCIINSFTASPMTVDAGGYSTLNWSVSNVISMSVDGIDSNSVGTMQRGPIQTTKTYQLLGNGPNGGTCSASVTVTVAPPGASNCIIDSFTASPSTVNPGDVTTLSWSVRNVTSMTVDNVDSFSAGSLTRGPLQSTRTYQLLGNGPNGGSCSRSVTVNVGSTPPPPPPPPGSCSIDYFPADSSYAGQVVVQWQSTGANSLTLSGGQFGSGVTVEPDGSRTIPLSSTTQFTVSGPTCSATAWMFASETPPPPPPPPANPCEIRTYFYFNNSFDYGSTGITYRLDGPATYWDEDRNYNGFGNPRSVVPGTYTISVPSSQTLFGYLSDLTGTDPLTVYCPSDGIARFYLKYQSRPILNIR